jgi:Group II intron, maturase-specific domain./Reverse transcriptase (RNA-dependent DNA polymerase).
MVNLQEGSRRRPYYQGTTGQHNLLEGRASALFKQFEEVRIVNAIRLTTPKEKVQELQEKLGYAAKVSKKRRFHALYDKVHRWDVLQEGNYRPKTDLGTPQGGVISPLLSNIYLNVLDLLWEKHGRQYGELTRYADDFVIICKTKKDAEKAMVIVNVIMKRLDLTLHPTKTRLIGMWTGKEGFDFLGMHHRKTKAETSRAWVYYTTQQWLSKKAEQHIRDEIKTRLAPPSARWLSMEDHVEYLNPKIRGWKNYYATPYSQRRMAKMDWYILQRFCRWYAKKTKRRHISVWHQVSEMLIQQNLLKLA